jgi:hypothetical protein
LPLDWASSTSGSSSPNSIVRPWPETFWYFPPRHFSPLSPSECAWVNGMRSGLNNPTNDNKWRRPALPSFGSLPLSPAFSPPDQAPRGRAPAPSLLVFLQSLTKEELFKLIGRTGFNPPAAKKADLLHEIYRRLIGRFVRRPHPGGSPQASSRRLYGLGRRQQNGGALFTIREKPGPAYRRRGALCPRPSRVPRLGLRCRGRAGPVEGRPPSSGRDPAPRRARPSKAPRITVRIIRPIIRY